MRFILSILFSVSIFFVLLNTPALAQGDNLLTTPSSSSYELFYPVVAGKVPGDFLYNIKLLREWIVDKLIVNDVKNADYHLIVSKKRLVEGESLLLSGKDIDLVLRTLNKVPVELEKALQRAKRIDERGQNSKDIINTLKSVSETEAKFIQDSILPQISEEHRDELLSIVEKVKSISEQL